MLNTRNFFEKLVVWLGILTLLVTTFWLLMRWPAPGQVFDEFLDSDISHTIERFQVLLGTVGGMTILAAAYLMNGHRDRRRSALEADSGARSVSHGLALEAADLADASDRQVVRLMSAATSQDLPDGEVVRLQELEKQLTLTDGLLLVGLDTSELARLGRNGHTGVNQLRQSLRILEHSLASVGDSGNPAGLAMELRELAHAYAGLAVTARKNQNLFETLYRRGIATADERTPPEPVDRSVIATYVRTLTEGAAAAARAAIPFRAAG